MKKRNIRKNHVYFTFLFFTLASLLIYHTVVRNDPRAIFLFCYMTGDIEMAHSLRVIENNKSKAVEKLTPVCRVRVKSMKRIQYT